MSLKAVVYARQSQDRTGTETAVSRQIEACQQLAAARGLDVIDVITDNDQSASSGKRRPGLERALEMVDTGQATRIVVYHVDRLYRTMTDLERIIELCERRSAGVLAVSGDLDLSNDTGRLLGRILAAVARGEMERKSARQRLANTQRASTGVMPWVRRPYGYAKADDGSIVIQPDEAEHLRWIAHQLTTGHTAGEVVRSLNARGIPTAQGPTWSYSTLRRTILNPRYTGRVVYRGADYGPGQWPAILDGPTHDALQAVFAGRTPTPGNKLRHLMSGALVCGLCGDPMRSHSQNGRTAGQRYLSYVCARGRHLSKPMARVDEAVTAVILARLASPDAAAAWTADPGLDADRAELVALRDRRDGVADLLADGLISRDKATATARELGERITALEQRLTAHEGGSPVGRIAASTDPAAHWAGLPVGVRRQIVDALAVFTAHPGEFKRAPWDPEQLTWEWKVV